MNNQSYPVLRTVLRVLLAASLIFAGIGHLSFSRVEFQAQVPDWVPLSKDLTVLLSGVVEVLLGTALLFIKKYRAEVGWIAAVFFILVFPGNVHQYTAHIDAFGLDTDNKRLIRLFFQPVLVMWALWSTGSALWPPPFKGSGK